MYLQKKDVHCEATKTFSPKRLSQFLIRGDDGTVYVNRSAALTTENAEKLFIVVMNYDYRWDYSNYNSSTIYFEVGDNVIIGGIYDEISKRKMTRRIIAATFGDDTPYIYTRKDFDNLLNLIKGT